jgi:hypothetical protein
MIAGHFGFAAGVKSRERTVPLWALMLATVWLDVVFVPLFILKIETVVPAQGVHQAYGGAFIYAAYTHSIVGAALLSLIAGLGGALVWGRRAGVVLGLIAFSHWVLDLVVHRPDLAILPGNAGNLPLLGFGLWNWPVPAALVELALVLIGGGLYWRSAFAVANAAGSPRLLAHVAGFLVVVFGIVVLGFDFTGILG